LDGEATFGWANSPHVTLDNTFPNTLLWLKTLFGGSVSRLNRRDDNCRTAFRYRIYGSGASSLCQKVLPFLKEKQAQAKIIIRLRETAPNTEIRRQLLLELGKHKRIDHA